MDKLLQCLVDFSLYVLLVLQRLYHESNAIFLCRVRCETLNTYQFKEFECIMGIPFIHFDVLLQGLSRYLSLTRL